VVRHEIDYKRPTYLGDEVILRTWVGNATRRSFECNTEIVRKKDLKILAKAVTLWSSVSSQTIKSIVPSDSIYERFSTNILSPTD
jgi:acyl-CoA thioester hydrolase